MKQDIFVRHVAQTIVYFILTKPIKGTVVVGTVSTAPAKVLTPLRSRSQVILEIQGQRP